MPRPASQAAKENGAYYTPDAVAATLVQWSVRSDSDTLLDPSCGDGRFIANHARSVGVERDPDAAALAQQRAPSAALHTDDFFAWARQTSQRFDCAAGNPPFIRYQTFKGAERRNALALCNELGVSFSALTASWAPFLVVTASLLRPGGRMAFVVPASIGHAPYAAPLVEYLVARFKEVRIVPIRQKLFPRLSEDCWLLFADGFGGSTRGIDFAPIEHFGEFRLSTGAHPVPVDEWRRVWNRDCVRTCSRRRHGRCTRRSRIDRTPPASASRLPSASATSAAPIRSSTSGPPRPRSGRFPNGSSRQQSATPVHCRQAPCRLARSQLGAARTNPCCCCAYPRRSNCPPR